MRIGSWKTAVAALAIGVVAVPSAAWAATRSFVVVNQNGQVGIDHVWFAAAGTKDVWEEITLDHVVKPGETSTFTMADGEVCMYDLKVQFTDGVVQTFANMNVCTNDKAMAT